MFTKYRLVITDNNMENLRNNIAKPSFHRLEFKIHVLLTSDYCFSVVRVVFWPLAA